MTVERTRVGGGRSARRCEGLAGRQWAGCEVGQDAVDSMDEDVTVGLMSSRIDAGSKKGFCVGWNSSRRRGSCRDKCDPANADVL